jgi:ornithine--oxo-acid transaminase
MFDIRQLWRDRAPESFELFSRHVNPSFAKAMKLIGFDVPYVRGSGAYLWDSKGTRYLDCLSGFGQFGVGRNHPVVRQALKDAMDLDLPNLPKFGTPGLSGLVAEKLIALAPGELDTVYFCNSGAEGVETAIKYARAATGRSRIIHCKKSYHGLTSGALSITSPEFQEGFGPLLADTTTVPFNDLGALETALSARDAAAFIVEPVQGKGVQIAADGYLAGAAELCRKHGSLFIADEVQTGLGRTGKMFAVEHWGVEPDILVISKALSGGYIPVGAVLSKRWIHEKVFYAVERCMVHSTTFGQNDLAMVAALATLHVLETEKLVENAARMGRRLMELTKGFEQEFEMVKEVRGLGLIYAVEFGEPRSLTLKMGWKMIHAANAGLFPQSILIPLLKEHHILAQTAGHNMDVVKLLPALVVSDQDVDTVAAGLRVWEIAKGLSKAAVSGSRKRDLADAAPASS